MKIYACRCLCIEHMCVQAHVHPTHTHTYKCCTYGNDHNHATTHTVHRQIHAHTHGTSHMHLNARTLARMHAHTHRQIGHLHDRTLLVIRSNPDPQQIYNRRNERGPPIPRVRMKLQSRVNFKTNTLKLIYRQTTVHTVREQQLCIHSAKARELFFLSPYGIDLGGNFWHLFHAWF